MRSSSASSGKPSLRRDRHESADADSLSCAACRLLPLFQGSARLAHIGIHVYTRHPRFTSPPERNNGHDVAAPALDVDPGDAIVRAALTKEELQNLLFEHIGLSKREC